MARIIFTFFLLFISLSISAQISEGEYTTLRKVLSKKINQLRVSKKLDPLESNLILRKAAKNHSVYMAKHSELSHNQRKYEMANPSRRVKFFKGDEFEIVGENVLQSATVKLPLTDRLIGIIANEMFQSWKNSPGHYKNMINPDYVFGDIDFQFNTKDKVIYATQVFGKKGIKIEGQLSDNAFGILEEDEFCYDAYGNFNNIVTNMGNSIHVEGNKVVFYYYDLDYFNKIFTNNKDGMAIDLFFRDQVSCGSENRIDYSPIYDGIMLRPVFKEEILKNNTAKSKYRIIAELGTIPDSLISKEFSCSIILIKNGIKCKYLIPGEVPEKRYKLRPISPKLKNPTNVKLKQSGIIESQELAYDFNTNITTPIKYPAIEKNNHTIHSVEITSYSSVEGDENKNSILHNSRAEAIKKHLTTKLKINHSKITIDAKENWAKMYFQLRYFLANDLADLSKESLKNILASDDNSLPWDSLLYDQRKSTAIIFYEGKISDTTDYEKLFTMNFKTAVLTKNFDLANKALFEMYTRNVLSTQFLFEDAIFKIIIQAPELTQNLAAIFSKTYERDQERTIEFLFNWLNKANTLSIESKTNLIHLYTLISIDLLSNWDLSAKRLSNVVHPSIVNKVIHENIKEELLLNLHLTFIRYYGQINDGVNISKSFNYIVDYFKPKALSIEDEIDLTLFFNRWSRYDLTNDYLLDKFEKGKLNEEAVFILLKTLSFYTKDEYDDISSYEEVYLKALELNQKKWCNWVDEEFQILRHQKIKDLFCNKCSSN